MIVQAVIFNNKKWDVNTARKWLKEHDYKPIKHVDKTENYLRYRIREPTFANYVLKPLGNSGIRLIFGIDYAVSK